MRNMLLIIFILLTGCKTKTILQPVDRIKIEYKDRFRIDSVYNRDTLFVSKLNDTIIINSIKWREKFIRDTLSITKIDSIPYPVEVIKEVNRLTKWQKLRLQLLNILGGLIAVFGAFKIGKLL